VRLVVGVANFDGSLRGFADLQGWKRDSRRRDLELMIGSRFRLRVVAVRML
jgi:hypothetical protein